MRMTLSISGAVMLAACAPAPIEQAEDNAKETAEPVTGQSEPGTPVDSLVGEYRVAGIDGAALDAPIGLALSISDSRITFDAHCGGYAWDYTLDGLDLATRRIRSPDPDCQTRAPVPGEVYALAAALDAAIRAVRTPSNSIELSGVRRSLTLYSQ